MKIKIKNLFNPPFLPKKLTYPNATIKVGTQNGTTENDNKIFFAKKFRFPQKKAQGIPTTRATKVEKNA